VSLDRILSAEERRENIKSCLADSTEVLLISAYITDQAIDWLIEHVNKETKVSIIGRLSPSDIVNGSSTINALRKILDQGWSLAALQSLHAKIYLLDKNKMFVGSANFTNRGLKIYGEGNLEAAVEVEVNSSNLEFVNNIVLAAVKLDHDIVEQMHDFAETNREKVGTITEWPVSIISYQEKIWVTDFPWINLNDKNNPEVSINHDRYLFGDDGEGFFKSKCCNWLKKVLREKEDHEIYFGELTAKLHDDLMDDPAPYRKEVKALLANMLSYIEKLGIKGFSIDTPKHSQRIKLLNDDT
jgi:hypothetical protein